jgi:hypothetical protein
MILRILLITSVLIIFFLLPYCSDPNSNNDKENTKPTAVFSVTPNFGNTTTMFEFNASSSNDKEDPDSTIEVRWDWENDEIWDTEYSTTKIVYYQFVEPGLKTIILEVRDSEGLTDTVSQQLNIILPNSPPNASFIVTPSIGDTSTLFEFDASGSNDTEDSSINLEVRWDWENDGTWDTEFSTSKNVSHQFLSSGLYEVVLQVRDTDGAVDSSTSEILVQPKFINYIPLKIGNTWIYEVETNSYSASTIVYVFEGVETWEIVSISYDSSSFKIKSVFNGLSYSHDVSSYYDSTRYTDVINFLDIKFVNGPSPEFPSQSIVLQNCENCVGRTILKTLFQ